MHDGLQVVLWFGLVALAAAILCLGYFAWQNPASRNLALATGTLVAAAMLFILQLRFELRADQNTDFITAEYTIDRAKPEIRQWAYGLDQAGQRLGPEIGASQRFAAAHPGQFDRDREKLTHDMVVFSLLAYLGVEQFDWQLKRTRFIGQSTGTQTFTLPTSKPHECTVFTKDQLRQMLLDVRNFFANGNVFFGAQSLCLPPKSTLVVRAGGLTLANPFCEIAFVLQPSGSVMFTQPGTGSLESPTLPNGQSKFETRPTGISVVVRYSAIRAQHRDMGKYREWSKRLIVGAQNWFEGNKNEPR
jgi:hypothetical protein